MNRTTTIQEVINCIEAFAPLNYQESYDNAGLIVGDKTQEVKGVLLCLDSIEEVIDEAIEKGCNLVIAHHPILFSGLKKITGKTYIERTIIKAIKNNVAIYAAHTNLDNVSNGVNKKIADKIGLGDLKILVPKSGLLIKLAVFVPESHVQEVLNAMFDAGAGNIGNYGECSFSSSGTGTFLPSENTNPHIGEHGVRSAEKEQKLEVILPSYLKSAVINSMKKAHPYEEVAFDLYELKNTFTQVGSGMVGELKQSLKTETFLASLKESFHAGVVKHTFIHKDEVKKIAICGGSGSFLLSAAKAAKADVFVTADYKYHQFFDAENSIIIADIGHYETEQFTVEIFHEILSEKFSNFAIRFSDINTNPVNYI